MTKEIGSEFWECPQKRFDKHYFLSGRTALEYIIREIVERDKKRAVLLPSYCCHTMIEPFVRHGFSIRFYDVFYSKEKRCLCAELPEYRKNEVMFYLSYFGFSELLGLRLEELKGRYPIIIDDRTHSWLRTASPTVHADYSFTSYRKWGGFSGVSEVLKYDGYFFTPVCEESSNQYVSMRDTAFQQKADYLAHGGMKDGFLQLFGEAETLLEDNYVDYRPSYAAIDALLSTDWEILRNRRRENAKVLLDGLADVKAIVLPFTELKDEDAPLFVPILVEQGRDNLRKYLVGQEVYCPVHWPKSELHASISERASELYATELSLLCDQRYGQKEMERIVSLIVNYYRKGC